MEHPIRRWRRRNGVSQAELGLLVGIPTGNSVYEYERGKRTAALRTCIALALVTGVSVPDLYPGITGEERRKVVHRLRILLDEGAELGRSSFARRRRELLEALLADLSDA